MTGDDEIGFLTDQDRRLLAIADELDGSGYDAAARAVMRAAEKVADLKTRALERE